MSQRIKVLSGQRIYDLKYSDYLITEQFGIDLSTDTRMNYFCTLHGEVYKGEHNCPKCKENQEKYNL